MKKTTILSAAAAICASLAMGAQAAEPVFGPGYANPQFWINNAAVKQSLSVSGCKPLNMPAKKTTLNNGNVTLFDDGSFVWLVDWSAQPQASYPASAVAVTGQWSQLLPDTKSSKTFYLSINTASMTMLLDDLQIVGLANCQTTKPLMTKLDILDPSVLVSPKKNTIVVKIKDSKATGSLTIKGSAESDPKGPAGGIVVGKTQMKLTMTGLFEAAP
jgi:hypothetical protein